MSKYNNLPKDSVVTRASALAIQGFISFSPSKVQLEMKQGTNTSNPAYDEYKISTQKIETINIGTITVEGLKMYGPERLFIQLEKSDLENTIFSEALRNLTKVVNPFVVEKIYKKIKKKRKGINHERIKKFLEDHLLNLEETLFTLRRDEKANFLREYVIHLCSKVRLPFLLKGGSAVELFSNIKRSTEDIDAHSGKSDNETILDLLANNKNEIYFKISDEDRKKVVDSTSKVQKIQLQPFSLKLELKKMLKDIQVPISFNNSYSSEELRDLISDFDLKARQLKFIKKTSCITFSKEMLLAEKFQSIISKPLNTKRTKDLIDLYLLQDGDINNKLFKKWLFKKWSKQRNPLNHEEAIKIIEQNKDLELTKIKENFDQAKNMYSLEELTFEQCARVYKDLIDVALH